MRLLQLSLFNVWGLTQFQDFDKSLQILVS